MMAKLNLPPLAPFKFHMEVEYERDLGTAEVLAAIQELVEKAREQGHPIKATLIGLPPELELAL